MPVSPPALASRPSRSWKVFAPPVLATLALLVFFRLYHPFVPVGDDLLGLRGFEAASFESHDKLSAWRGWGEFARWDPHAGFEESAGVVLSSDGKRRGGIRLDLDEPRRFEALTFRGRLRTMDLKRGSKDWLRARFVVFFRDAEGKPNWSHPHTACFLEGTHDWMLCRETFIVPSFAESVTITAQNGGTSGLAVIDDLELRPAVRRASATPLLTLAALVWAAGFTLPLLELRPWKRRYGLVTVVAALAIVVGVAAPAHVIGEALRLPDRALVKALEWWSERGTAEDAIPEPDAASAPRAEPGTPRAPASDASTGGAATAAPAEPVPHPSAGTTGVIETPVPEAPSSAPSAAAAPAPEPREPSFDLPDLTWRVAMWKNVGHAALFAILGFAAVAAARSGRPRWPLPGLFLALVIFAAGTEVLQFLVWKRQPALSDLGIDSAGIVCGMALCLAVRGAWSLVRPRPSAPPA